MVPAGAALNPAFHLIHHHAPPADLSRLPALAVDAWTYHRALPEYQPTPLCNLGGLARELGLASIHLKDESMRFGLNAFKGLGASYAIHRWLTHHPEARAVTFTTATDGNHGRAVAWSARRSGARAVIFMPTHSVAARIEAIAREEAEVVLVDEGYDAAVVRAHEAAEQAGWVLIQDCARPGYEEIPEWIAAGYWTLAKELEATIFPVDAPAVDLVVLHAGVGTWPAAMVSYLWHRYGVLRPRIVVVEPAAADCVLASIVAGQPSCARGSLRTIMAGLNCGWPSTTAVGAIAHGVDALMAIPDLWAERAMRCLANPADGDLAVVAGESGAASVAGLLALVTDPLFVPVAEHLDLGRRSRVLVWSTEGATDPEGWARVVGRPVPS
jgi:diaminopropionate ammonia-lyase